MRGSLRLATNVVVDGETIEADAVICATTATMALEIIPALPEPLRQVLSKIVYSVGVRVVMGLDHHPLPPGWTAVLYPEDETPLLLDRSSYLSALCSAWNRDAGSVGWSRPGEGAVAAVR